jgi:hypothetical protein
MVTEEKNHWVPTGPHGVLPYKGEDVEKLIRLKMKEQPMTYFTDIKYLIETSDDGTQSITFEVR